MVFDCSCLVEWHLGALATGDSLSVIVKAINWDSQVLQAACVLPELHCDVSWEV